jgi:hypothetical protein
VGIAQERLAVLHEQTWEVLEKLLDASARSRGDIGQVEGALRTSLLSLRRLMLTEALRVSVACAERTYCCEVCGRGLSAHSARERVVVTAEGEATYRSVRYRCRRCGEDYYPLEAANGLSGSHFTTGAKGLIAQTSAALPYARTAAVLAERGIHVSAKEVDRTTAEVSGWREAEEQAAVRASMQPASSLKRALGEDGEGPPSSAASAACMRSALGSLHSWEGWQEAEPALVSVDAGKVRSPEQGENGLDWFECRLGIIAPAREGSRAPTFYVGGVHGVRDVDALFRLLAAAWRMGGRGKRRLVFCADGAEWIWRRAALWFPEAVQVVDIYHVGEHVGSAAAACWGETSARAREWKRNARTMLLKQGGPQRILQVLARELQHGEPADREKLQTEYNYLYEHRERMPYAQLHAEGLPIGSGAMESGVKQVSTQRLRLPGMMWTRHGADRMVSLRAAHLSGILPATIARQHAKLWTQAVCSPHTNLKA